MISLGYSHKYLHLKFAVAYPYIANYLAVKMDRAVGAYIASRLCNNNNNCICSAMAPGDPVQRR